MGTVIEKDEVLLNGVRYPIIGRVRKRLINRAPVRLWTLNNLTKGMGKLERKSDADDGYLWWCECDIDHAGHIIPPPLAVALASVPTATKTSPTGYTDPSAEWNSEANAYDSDWSTAATSTKAGGAWTVYLQLSVASMSIVGLAVKVGASTPDANDQVDIDYYDGSWHDVYSGAFTDSQMLVKLVTASAVTQMRIRIYNAAGGAETLSIYEAYFLSASTISTLKWCNFNSNLYCGINSILCKLDTSTGNTLTNITLFPANITDLVNTVSSSMAILLGDSDELWYMNTSDVVTETDETGAYYGVHWGNKFCWINSSGSQLSYATAMAAALAETDNGGITDKVTVRGLDVYQDATGISIVYARTDVGVYAHDTATPKFYKINLELPSHTGTAKAGLFGNNGYYISQGIQIYRYTTGNYNAEIDSKIGLDALDGVPSEQNGHIVHMAKGQNFIYALYDSTAIGTGGYSWVGKYNELTGSWSCLWKTGTVNQAMNVGIYSTAYASRYWFDCGGVIYYIPLPTTNLFRKLVSDSTYATPVSIYTSWFEGSASTFARTATEIISFAKSITTTETIVIAYRLNRTSIDLSTDWNTIVTLDSTGENNRVSTLLASGLGLDFNSFQFKITLSRGTSTNAPDLQNLTLKYIENTTPKWAFSFIINLMKPYKGNTSEQLEDALEVAAESTTLLTFQYRDRATVADTYVKVVAEGKTLTGERYQGQYNLTVYEP